MKKNKIKVICFDIDQVICKTNKNFYNKSKPNKNTIMYINALYNSGYTIKIFTARYMGSHKEDVNLIKKKFYKKTLYQLKKWGLKFHKLYMGKPSFDIFVDDKSLDFKKSWQKQLSKLVNVKK